MTSLRSPPHSGWEWARRQSSCAPTSQGRSVRPPSEDKTGAFLILPGFMLHGLHSKQGQLKNEGVSAYIQPWLTARKLYCWQGRPRMLGPQMPSPQLITDRTEISVWERQAEKIRGCHSLPSTPLINQGCHSETNGPLSLPQALEQWFRDFVQGRGRP